MNKIMVRLGKNGYKVLIGEGLLTQPGYLLKECGFSNKVVIVTNDVIKGLYGDQLKTDLDAANFNVVVFSIPEGENQKALSVASRLYAELSDFHADRNTPVIALGGGVIGDLAGFVAATYLRGLPLIQVPTTLLAQCDSSIGGKVAVDFGNLKNQIGTFYQPLMVVDDLNTLHTLPQTVFIDGLAEVIKYAVLGDKNFFKYLENNMNKIKTLDKAILEEVVYKSVAIKAAIVEKDERDTGIRNVLNFGHTVGHAVESASNFKITHGQAVATGMIAAGKIACKLGVFRIDSLNRLIKLIEQVGLLVSKPSYEIQQILLAMEHDKKIVNGKIKFVLPADIGRVFFSEDVSRSLVEEVLESWI